MKNISMFFCALFFISSCNYSTGNKKNNPLLSSQETTENLTAFSNAFFSGDSTLNIQLISINQDQIDLDVESFIVDNFGKIIKANTIKSISFDQTKNIDKYGETSFYQIQFKEEATNMFGERCFLFVNKNKKEAGLLWLNKLIFYSFSSHSNTWLIAGIHKVRGKGYFLIYSHDNAGWFDCIFSSGNERYCGNGVPVYDSSLDCQSYSPFALDLQQIDVDNNGLIDLVFKGNLLTFCEGLERGVGRNDGPPNAEDKIEISFITMISEKKFYWTSQSNGLCNKLIDY